MILLSDACDYRLLPYLWAASTSCFLCCSATMAKRRGTNCCSLWLQSEKKTASPASSMATALHLKHTSHGGQSDQNKQIRLGLKKLWETHLQKNGRKELLLAWHVHKCFKEGRWWSRLRGPMSAFVSLSPEETQHCCCSTNTSHCANETGEIVNKKVGMFLEFLPLKMYLLANLN